MPSSSTRSTALEHQIYTLYRHALARLWSPSLRSYAHFTQDVFASLLDISANELERLLQNTSVWEDLLEENGKLRMSARVWDAAAAFANVEAVLGKVGREREGVRMGEWARELGDLAGKCGEWERGQR